MLSFWFRMAQVRAARRRFVFCNEKTGIDLITFPRISAPGEVTTSETSNRFDNFYVTHSREKCDKKRGAEAKTPKILKSSKLFEASK